MGLNGRDPYDCAHSHERNEVRPSFLMTIFYDHLKLFLMNETTWASIVKLITSQQIFH